MVLKCSLKYFIKKKKSFLLLFSEIKKIEKNNKKGFYLFFSTLNKTLKTIIKAKITCETKKHKNKHEFEYYFRENKYKIFINQNKIQICRIMEVKDENNIDITEKIKKYAGPFENFHHMDITPKMLNLKTIKIKLFDEDQLCYYNLEFNENDILDLDNNNNKILNSNLIQDENKDNFELELLSSEEEIDKIIFHFDENIDNLIDYSSSSKEEK
jgi:hypothetical protein